MSLLVFSVAVKHHVNSNRTLPPFPDGTESAIFGESPKNSAQSNQIQLTLSLLLLCFLTGMGCFWGAERKFWRQTGVYSTQVGYAGGYTPNPTYSEVCSGNICIIL